MKLTEQNDGHKCWNCGKCWGTYNKRKADWRTESFYRQTQSGVLRGPKRNVYVHSCIAWPQSWGCNQSKHHLFETDTVELEGTQIPHGQLFQLQMKPRERSKGSRLDSEKYETSMFHHTSETARIVIETANDRLERTRCWTKNGTVQPQYSPRPRLYFLRQSTTCSKSQIW